MEQKWKVAFLCKHNSCRSQIAEALAKKMASDVMEVYSAGVELGKDINGRAVRILKTDYDIDLLKEGYYTKLVSSIPEVDIVIYMGCSIECVSVSCQIELDWGVESASNGSDESFKKMIKTIEERVLKLREDIITGEISQWKKDNVSIDFSKTFSFWNQLTEKQKERIHRSWRLELFDKGRIIYNTTQGCKGVLILQKGSMRIYMVSPEGREVTLYRLNEGEVCVLAAACLMEEIDFDILIEAVEYTETVTIPAADLQPIIKENKVFENYLYKKTAERFTDVMWTIQNILFKKVDQRIARCLLEEMFRQDCEVVEITQEEIAHEIGSAREVVTKTMKHMAGDQLIKNGRGKVEILNKQELYKLI